MLPTWCLYSHLSLSLSPSLPPSSSLPPSLSPSLPLSSGMAQYTTTVREHVATGNAMLALSDSDMEKKLGVANPLHRRKLRLAIEEQRRPDRSGVASVCVCAPALP